MVGSCMPGHEPSSCCSTGAPRALLTMARHHSSSGRSFTLGSAVRAVQGRSHKRPVPRAPRGLPRTGVSGGVFGWKVRPEAAIAYSTDDESPALGPGLVNLKRHDLDWRGVAVISWPALEGRAPNTSRLRRRRGLGGQMKMSGGRAPPCSSLVATTGQASPVGTDWLS